MIAFIDEHRAAYGVEPICKALQIAPSTYHAHAARRPIRHALSARAQRDAALKPTSSACATRTSRLRRAQGLAAAAARRLAVARCTVERLMRRMGLHGVVRGKAVRTTVSDKARLARWTT